MSALSRPHSRGSSRGRGSLRAGVRSRASRVGIAAEHNIQDMASRAMQSGLKDDRRGAPNVMTRGSRHTSSAPTRLAESKPHTQRSLSQIQKSNKTQKSTSPLNAAFHSHAGKAMDSLNASWRNPPFADTHLYSKQMNDLYQMLKQNRERDRKQAIKDGFLADPEKPTTLAHAITPVGTCQDMCPEFERVERIVQLMVDGREKIQAARDTEEKVAHENIMVKRFRRSAAGYDEQLPSDIRPPLVLQNTLDYLFHDVVGGPEPLATVHKFVWDRTRSIRNDFSIQQVSKVEDLRIAINCFERIARFHILSLHQLSAAHIGADGGEFDFYQEREQLNNTLLSLQYYYDDSRHKLVSPNEPEFRAYGIIFEIQSQRPDVEDRLQSLPKDILKDQRVGTALRLHAAAANIADEQGPLRPRTQSLVAQANFQGFWRLVRSNAVSYLMACVAEIFFNTVRRTALEAVWKAYKGKRLGPTKMEDWTLTDLAEALGFDNGNEAKIFCEEHEFTVGVKSDQEQYIDLGSVTHGSLTDQNPQRKQIFSKTLVEIKRLDRTLPAVINGMSASQAQPQGFVEKLDDTETASTADSEPLFIDGESDIGKEPSQKGEYQNQQTLINNAPQNSQNINTSLNPFSLPKPGTSLGSTLSQRATLRDSATNLPNANTPPEIGYPENLADTPLTGAGSAWPWNKVPSKFNSFVPNNPVESRSNDYVPNDIGAPESGLDLNAGKNSRLVGTSKEESSNSRASGIDAPNVLGTNAIANQVAASKINASNGPHAPFKDFLASSSPPAFSFGTSPLFGIGSVDQTLGKGVDTSRLNADDETAQAPFSDPAAIDETLPQPSIAPKSSMNFFPSQLPEYKKPFTTPAAGAQPNSSLFAPAVSKQLEASTATLGAPFSIPATGGFLPTALGSSSPKNQQSPMFPLVKPTNITSPNTTFTTALNSQHSVTNQLDASGFSPSAHNSRLLPDSSLLSTPVVAQARQDRFTTTPEGKAAKELALDRLSDAVMLEGKGLLEQFIAFTLEPIIRSSLIQFENDESWKEAKKARLILLSKKYFKKWRTNAWCLGLMRKGKDRRKTFMLSIHGLSESPQDRRNDRHPSCGPRWTTYEGPISATVKDGSSTAVLPSPMSVSKGQSLPMKHDASGTVPISEFSHGVKRKRNDQVDEISGQTPRSVQVSHRRSPTVDASAISAISAPELGRPSGSYASKLLTPKLVQASISHDALMKRARRQLPTARSDTTRTDYFRLKALGIDPDSPAVPRTKDRAQVLSPMGKDNEITETSASSSISTRKLSKRKTNPITPSVILDADDDDDANDNDAALFAQIRSMREALAESEHWYQAERQSIERSSASRPISNVSNDPVALPNTVGSSAQCKLRETKERRFTPTRSELRLRALGEKALVPKGFWDGEGMGSNLVKANAKERPEGLVGFPPTTSVNGLFVKDMLGPNNEPGKGGTSAEDAIEL